MWSRNAASSIAYRCVQQPWCLVIVVPREATYHATADMVSLPAPKATGPLRGVERYHDARSGVLLAIVVRDDFVGGQYNFLTPDDFPMQLGVSQYESGQVIQPHLHVDTNRDVSQTQEFIYVKRGRVRLHLYASDRVLVAQVELRDGDCVLLANGGHGFDVLEGTQMIEAKQGPYLGVGDKIRFEP